jgi:hypothetical protein
MIDQDCRRSPETGWKMNLWYHVVVVVRFMVSRRWRCARNRRTRLRAVGKFSEGLHFVVRVVFLRLPDLVILYCVLRFYAMGEFLGISADLYSCVVLLINIYFTRILQKGSPSFVVPAAGRFYTSSSPGLAAIQSTVHNWRRQILECSQTQTSKLWLIVPL